ncbi:response regulator [Paenibacillus sedimenti]|uniref:Response regulator n=1 Tax=Paenibacillus sedimenti TaxID=2770274 RepID=A0A926QLW3_9BACL|nr:response regulator [Paenibacillus sedimenti]MBD0384341.1 response regulator [Paenibacillus sedimenti]
MWTILLVEDEGFVRRSIRNSMRWEEKGFQVVAEAGNGLEALELIRKHRPHLVISDIRMPVMDGVELLKQARQEGFYCRFVMLSVLNEFDYVQQAMEYGASNYVLKLYLSVEKMHEVLEKVDLELQQLNRMSLRNMQDVYDAAWGIVTAGGIESPLLAMPSYPAERLMIKAILHGHTAFGMDDLRQLKIVPQEFLPHAHLFSKIGITTVFSWVSADQTYKLDTHVKLPYAIAYAGPVASDEWLHTWKSALCKLNELWYKAATGLFLSTSDRGMDQPDPSLWQEEREVLRIFELKQKEALLQSWHTYWERYQAFVTPIAVVKEAAGRLDRLFAHISGVRARSESEMPESVSHRQLGEIMAGRLCHYMDEMVKRQHTLTDHPEINKVIAYLENNYREEITLEFLSRYTAMDDKYLSGLFKKKTGKTLIHYLHEIRIEQARRFLEHTDWPVALVGEKVGFATESYFTKIFKRITGMTPSAYRQYRLEV